MESFLEVSDGVRLWVEESGRTDGSPLLLVMGANASGVAWPDELVAALGARHRVVRYDHRDTGRSTAAFDRSPYAVADLAHDAVKVLDGLGIHRAHVVGMSMGGTLVQLLLIDFPDRLLSATVFATGVLEGSAGPEGPQRPFADIDPRLLALWEHLSDPRDRDAEIAFRIEHWRILNGEEMPFDAEEFRRLEERVIDHTGRHDNPAAHARADQSGLDRGSELATVTVPTLVIDAPADPVNPPTCRPTDRHRHPHRAPGDDPRNGSCARLAGHQAARGGDPHPHGTGRPPGPPGISSGYLGLTTNTPDRMRCPPAASSYSLAARVKPSAIIMLPPSALSLSSRCGLRANHSRALPAPSAHRLSEHTARAANTTPSTASCGAVGDPLVK